MQVLGCGLLNLSPNVHVLSCADMDNQSKKPDRLSNNTSLLCSLLFSVHAEIY